jgi:hypothetical protein
MRRNEGAILPVSTGLAMDHVFLVLYLPSQRASEVSEFDRPHRGSGPKRTVDLFVSVFLSFGQMEAPEDGIVTR